MVDTSVEQSTPRTPTETESPAQSISVTYQGEDFETQCMYVKKETEEVVKKIAVLIRRGQPYDFLQPRLESFLAWLENGVKMSSKLAESTQLDRVLVAIATGTNRYTFPVEYATRAQTLCNRLAADRCGGTQERIDGPYRRLAIQNYYDITLSALPPETHPIWGVEGIMYGAMLHEGRYIERNDLRNKGFHVFGHNDLKVGQWFPNRLLARIHGAHGEVQAGISGTMHAGAYSIVLSSQYSDLDRDDGNTILYSGSASHGNTNTEEPAESTRGTMALKTSIITQKPVRVLRNNGAVTFSSSISAPSQGIRYDGLYRVTSMNLATNLRGGCYEQFHMERLPDQISLSDIRTPTARQLRDHSRIRRDRY